MTHAMQRDPPVTVEIDGKLRFHVVEALLREAVDLEATGKTRRRMVRSYSAEIARELRALADRIRP